MTKDEEIMELRRLLWLSHGHKGLYGDDGEMQCNECMEKYGFWDWKRTPIEEITQKITEANIKELLANQKDSADICIATSNHDEYRRQCYDSCPHCGLDLNT